MTDDVNDFFSRHMSDENKAFCERQAETLKNTVIKKVEKLRKKVQKVWDEIKPNLDERMEEMANRGYCGFEFYEHNYLGHPSLTEFFAGMFAELGVQGKYMLFYHIKTCTVSIVFNKNFIKTETLTIGDYGPNNRPILKAVTYTTTQESKKRYKIFKAKIKNKMLELEKLKVEVQEMKDKLNEVYFAPGMPGFITGFESFGIGQKEELQRKTETNQKHMRRASL